MSDFGEICPLFSTGVFHEVTFPKIHLSLSSSTCNALEGSCTAGALSTRDNFTFGRTVVVTDVYCRRYTLGANSTVWVHIKHLATAGAASTIFGTVTFSMDTASLHQSHYTYAKATHTDATFTSDEVLGISLHTLTAAEGGEYDVIVQYKEK